MGSSSALEACSQKYAIQIHFYFTLLYLALTIVLFCIISKKINIELWHALEIRVRSYSRSLKMAPFIRSYTTSYQSTIVSIALYYTIFKTYDVEEYCNL